MRGTCLVRGGSKGRQSNSQTTLTTDAQTDRQTGGRTDRQTDTGTDRLTKIV